MWNNFKKAVAFRLAFVFAFSHLGLVIGLVGLSQQAGGLGAVDFKIWAAFGMMIGSLYLTTFFLVQPVRKALSWRDWVLKELPLWLALIPVLIPVFKAVKALFTELSKAPIEEWAQKVKKSDHTDEVISGITKATEEFRSIKRS